MTCFADNDDCHLVHVIISDHIDFIYSRFIDGVNLSSDRCFVNFPQWDVGLPLCSPTKTVVS